MASLRIKKINELIQQELGKIFIKDFNFPPDCLTTITNVDTSADLGQAKIAISVMPEEYKDIVLKNLNKKTGFFRFHLSKIITLRKIPTLIFIADITQKNVSEIDKLIDKIHSES